ncbi:GSCOCG00008777001-RA-CDS [Cotesia congregata]|uniref:Tudor domain-containing protein 3 n=1 Tax=Cotesia congregata TaxID=51543 RepID=A0A8J2HL20_COTCN|nr:GSCOCG00008777001-RA-CDS [Cotesia congregata]CAG5104498.1 Similar to TDRD3: Tudor domain-containing protein 3 (Gallus gallus) [Cotesia congregata]
MDKLKEQGWYLSDQGFKVVSNVGAINDLSLLIKRAVDLDLREIASGEGDFTKGNLVVQILKLRNVAVPKNKEANSMPRMLKLYLTDGKNNYQAVEYDHIRDININTPPGTKIIINSGGILMVHGIIILKSSDVKSLLGGRVQNLMEKWELNKKLTSYTRVRSVEEGGPPPWIPFGQQIIKVTDKDKKFKSLAADTKDGGISKDQNSEFEAQRQDAIAEASKQGSKKVFGGGNKQLLDHSVQKIVDQGFTIDQAEYALKINRNNVDRALKSLIKNDPNNKQTREPREPKEQREHREHRESREPREPRGKRSDKKNEEAKPSSGKISLFDFLEDKLPAQSSTEQTDSCYNNVNNSNSSNYYGNSRFENERHSRHHHHHHQQHNNKSEDMPHNSLFSNRGGKSQKGGRTGYQTSSRNNTDNNKPYKKNNDNIYNNTNVLTFGMSNMSVNSSSSSSSSLLLLSSSSHQNKPPRFQNQAQAKHQDFNYQQQTTDSSNVKKLFDRNNPSIQNKNDYSNYNGINNESPFKRNHQKNQIDNRYAQYDIDPNKQSYNNTLFNKQHNIKTFTESNPKTSTTSNTYENNYNKNELNKYQQNDFVNINSSNFHSNQSDYKNNYGNDYSKFNNSNNSNINYSNGTWAWKKGDQCMAKYWEDNKYYNAEVTAVSSRTCVVQFKEFKNYEEVLQVDCIPITEDISQSFVPPEIDSRRSGRPPRYDQHNQHKNSGIEFKRGGGSASSIGAGGSNRGHNKKRTQQRTAQPIYQPPAQRR